MQGTMEKELNKLSKEQLVETVLNMDNISRDYARTAEQYKEKLAREREARDNLLDDLEKHKEEVTVPSRMTLSKVRQIINERFYNEK